MFYKVINNLSARYKFSASATPWRSIKGTEKALFSLIGDIICEIPKEQITDRIVKASIIPIKSNFEIPRSAQKYDGTLEYSKLMTALCEDEERNELILDILKKCENNYTLVLSDRLFQLEYLQNKLGYGVKIDGTMTSKKGKEQREKAIENMRSGKEHVLLASYRFSS